MKFGDLMGMFEDLVPEKAGEYSREIVILRRNMLLDSKAVVLRFRIWIDGIDGKVCTTQIAFTARDYEETFMVEHKLRRELTKMNHRLDADILNISE